MTTRVPSRHIFLQLDTFTSLPFKIYYIKINAILKNFCLFIMITKKGSIISVVGKSTMEIMEPF